MSDVGIAKDSLEEHIGPDADGVRKKKSKKKKRTSNQNEDGQAANANTDTNNDHGHHGTSIEIPDIPPQSTINDNDDEVVIKKKKKRTHLNTNYTVSIALPGSILSNAQNAFLKSYLAGQIGRALAIFNIDEVIVFDDYNGQHKEDCSQMAHILQYLECPQYLRKHIFPVHSDLQYAGVMNPLDIPHHLRKHEMLPFREGIVVTKPLRDRDSGCFVHVGLEKDVHVDTKLPEGIRVTVRLDENSSKKRLTGTLVDPTVPKIENNLYWGYNVRTANSFNSVFSQCPYGASGYDVTIGTSDKGTSIEDPSFELKLAFQHMLIVFGGLHGLEFALENDETLTGSDVSAYFHHYLNTCPGQGSRTIRTEEAILITMARLKPIITSAQQVKAKRKSS